MNKVGTKRRPGEMIIQLILKYQLGWNPIMSSMSRANLHLYVKKYPVKRNKHTFAIFAMLKK